MKEEHPILFSTPMVQAILSGQKTMTRRVVKHPASDGEHGWHPCVLGKGMKSTYVGFEWMLGGSKIPSCPYGQVGDHLWVRETFCFDEDDNQPFYKATEKHPEIFPKWKPSIFMRREYSRITLEITNIRVERLQEIAGKDILKEGAVLRAHDNEFGHNPISAFDNKVYLDLTSLWAFGWDKINGKKYPWASNPWVWVIEFKKVTP